MSPGMKSRIAERRTKQEKEKLEREEREKMHRVWRESLPDLAPDIISTLEDACETGMMELLIMIDNDPDVLSKLRAWSQYCLRNQADSYEKDVKRIQHELVVKEKFMGAFSEIKEVFNKLPKPDPKKKEEEYDKERWTKKRVRKDGRYVDVLYCVECEEEESDCDCEF